MYNPSYIHVSLVDGNSHVCQKTQAQFRRLPSAVQIAMASADTAAGRKMTSTCTLAASSRDARCDYASRG